MPAKAPLIYRLLLLLLPSRFRRDFGADLEAVLVERLREAPGAAARAWTWLIAGGGHFHERACRVGSRAPSPTNGERPGEQRRG